jgi:glutaminyl-tRNA synthetase
VKATIHWVSAEHSLPAEVRLYDHLFGTIDPEEASPGKTWLDNLNPNSLQVIPEARLEPSLVKAQVGDRFQFERLGYFSVDYDSKPGRLVFNRTVTLRDEWAKLQKKQGG